MKIHHFEYKINHFEYKIHHENSSLFCGINDSGSRNNAMNSAVLL